jgi:hypothetical protein
MKAVLLLLASMVGFTAAFGTFVIVVALREGRWFRCMRRGDGGAFPWLKNSAHGRRTGLFVIGPTTSDINGKWTRTLGGLLA